MPWLDLESKLSTTPSTVVAALRLNQLHAHEQLHHESQIPCLLGHELQQNFN